MLWILLKTLEHCQCYNEKSSLIDAEGAAVKWCTWTPSYGPRPTHWRCLQMRQFSAIIASTGPLLWSWLSLPILTWWGRTGVISRRHPQCRCKGPAWSPHVSGIRPTRFRECGQKWGQLSQFKKKWRFIFFQNIHQKNKAKFQKKRKWLHQSANIT